MSRPGLVLIAMAVTLTMAPASRACTRMAPEPALDLKFLRDVWAMSDAVFLARAAPDPQGSSTLTPIVRIKGPPPPRRSRAAVNVMCGDLPPQGTIVAFAQRVGYDDVGWRFWLWGRWQVIGHRRPDEIVDPALARDIRRAADSLERRRG